ncbi:MULTISPECIES: helix-turn-helix domain-containing protein [Streptomyces]|uniref:helix-turn-helix domain-containing protein n=1 Tax=Streptomyces TaxID=1883 RepID=UPI000996962E|nr:MULTISPECIES: helix-turn-helix transcriptional regulator [Streptomyces]
MSGATGRKAIIVGTTGDQVRANLLRLRTVRRLSTRALADSCKRLGRYIPPTGITRIEKGERRVDVDDLLVLAEALQVPYAQLIEPPPPCTSCQGAPPIGFSCLSCGVTAEGEANV